MIPFYYTAGFLCGVFATVIIGLSIWLWNIYHEKLQGLVAPSSDGRLYLTCGYCGQSVPSDDGFHVNPHKYTAIVEEMVDGKIRIDCPQGRA